MRDTPEKDLADQWKYSQPEKVTELEQNGENLEDVAKNRLESAEANRQSILETMQARTREEYKDDLKKMEEELKRDEWIAMELMNEELKNL